MQYGLCYLTKISCTLMSTVSSLNAQMVYFGVFIQESLHILQIIQKSECFPLGFLVLKASFHTIAICRILLATIRNFGLCPCPRCFISKDKIPDVGKVYDDRRRNTASRIDSTARNFDINTARKFIYENGEGVKSAAVERVLRDKSFVPTTVCPMFAIFQSSSRFPDKSNDRMPFLRFCTLDSIFSKCLYPTSCTNSN